MKKAVVSWGTICLSVVLSLISANQMQGGPTQAAPVTLAWNPANDPSITGYAIYYGLANQAVTNRFYAGTNTTATIFGLLAEVRYRFYAVSCNVAGLESVPSNEIQFTAPTVSSIELARQGDGNMQLKGRVAPGSVCTVQFTPTLHSPAWRTLKHVTADQAGNVLVVDTSRSKAGRRFYRLVWGALPLLGEMQIQRQPDGSMLVSGRASPGTNCRVQYASSITSTSWQTLRTVTADADGNVTALDPSARQASRRFYRMALP